MIRIQTTPVRHGSQQRNNSDFGWCDLGAGIAGSLVGATVEGVGGTLVALRNVIPITVEAEKGLWSSKMLGPRLKSSVTLPLLVAGSVAPGLAALAGVGYGLVEGFAQGVADGPLAAGSAAIETCREMDGTLSREMVQSIRDAAAKAPAHCGDVYEINIVQAAQGLVGSFGSAAIDGVGVAAATWRHIPDAWRRASQEIWASDAALPLKMGGEFMAAAALALAVPMAPLGGLLYGLGKGAYNGYRHGLIESVRLAGCDIADYDQSLGYLLSGR